MPVYDLDLSYADVPPSADERDQVGAFVRLDRDASGPPPIVQIGDLALRVLPADAAVTCSAPDGWADEPIVEPMVAVRNQRLAIDSRIRSNVPRAPEAAPAALAVQVAAHLDPFRDMGTLLPAMGLDAAASLPAHPGEPVKVAIIDTSWAQLDALDPARHAALKVIDLGSPRRAAALQEAGHGTLMAAMVLVASTAYVLPYQLGTLGGSYNYIGATQLAAAIGQAYADGAEVILIARNTTIIGSPRHLRRVLREVSTARDGRTGAVIVWSAGDLSQTGGGGGSAALLADDPVCMPWGLVVASCDQGGAWLRRGGNPVSRLGPSVDLAAIGLNMHVVADGVSGMIDDSSSACAFGAIAAAIVIAHNRALVPGQVHELLCATARRRDDVEVDPTADALAGGCNEWDRAGHNFKLGHGMLDARRATLAASDPICAAFVLAGRTGASDTDEPGLALAQRWFDLVSASEHPLVVEYRVTWAPRIVASMLDHREVRRPLAWCARHLTELSANRSATWVGRGHQAVLQRVLVALWECAEIASCTELRSFAARVERAIVEDDGGGASGVIDRLVTP